MMQNDSDLNRLWLRGSGDLRLSGDADPRAAAAVAAVGGSCVDASCTAAAAVALLLEHPMAEQPSPSRGAPIPRGTRPRPPELG